MGGMEAAQAAIYAGVYAALPELLNEARSARDHVQAVVDHVEDALAAAGIFPCGEGEGVMGGERVRLEFEVHKYVRSEPVNEHVERAVTVPLYRALPLSPDTREGRDDG